MKLLPALCLDFDGTIRRTKSGKSFIDSPEDIELMPDIERRIWYYRNTGSLIVGITNQGGVAYGHRTAENVEQEIAYTLRLFGQNPFHQVQSCIQMAGGHVEPYCHRSLCRKPDIGMLVLAERTAYLDGYIIDWDNSLLVGDRPEDKECAGNAGIRFMHIDDFLELDI